MFKYFRDLTALVIIATLSFAPLAHADDTYSMEEITTKATGFFGDTTEGLAKAIEKVFNDHGRHNAFIIGEEVSGAIGVGLRYGPDQNGCWPACRGQHRVSAL